MLNVIAAALPNFMDDRPSHGMWCLFPCVGCATRHRVSTPMYTRSRTKQYVPLDYVIQPYIIGALDYTPSGSKDYYENVAIDDENKVCCNL